MPSRNVLKIDLADSYYHVYLRGNSRRDIFLDQEDHRVFLSLFKRYFSLGPTKDNLGRVYPNFVGKVDLLAFCLMPNHFHLLVYQIETGELSRAMRALLTSYSRYFNKKYNKSGSLFESRYKGSRISNDAYLLHISRYIHLNPKNWRSWEWSSVGYYLGQKSAQWLKTGAILGLFSSMDSYRSFLEDLEDHRQYLELINQELADS